MDPLLGPVFFVGISCLVYAAAAFLYRKVRLFVMHPVLVSIAVLIAILRMLDIEYEQYRDGTIIIQILLEVSVVALALPLYRRLHVLRMNVAGVVAGVGLGANVRVVTAIAPFLFLSTHKDIAISAAPSSVTTPIAMAIADVAGGIPSLTAVIVVITGILGAVLGPSVLRLARVRDPIAFGLALGTAAHGLGTARALEEGELQGATSSLGLCLNGLLTAAITPSIVSWLLM
jgi:predicted murein hydrolase (TIGR00659 family)